MESISALLFDWDGTLVDSAQLGLVAYEKSFAELGVPFDHEAYRAVYSPNWLTVYEGLGLPKEHWQGPMNSGRTTMISKAPTIEGASDGPAMRQKVTVVVVSSGNDCRVNREIKELGSRLLKC